MIRFAHWQKKAVLRALRPVVIPANEAIPHGSSGCKKHLPFLQIMCADGRTGVAAGDVPVNARVSRLVVFLRCSKSDGDMSVSVFCCQISLLLMMLLCRFFCKMKVSVAASSVKRPRKLLSYMLFHLGNYCMNMSAGIADTNDQSSPTKQKLKLLRVLGVQTESQQPIKGAQSR